MQFEKIHNKGQARIFKNTILENLTKGHPAVIWAMHSIIILFMIYYCNFSLSFSGYKIGYLFLAGVFSWTLMEYLLHRFIFHLPVSSDRGKRISYIIHGNHHHYPRDKERLFMPPLPNLILATVFFSIFYLLLGINVFAFFPGFLLGYLIYASMHYAIHAWNPPFKWMKPLWRNHHLHHYKDGNKGFGVSSTFWDHIFGTLFDLKVEKEDKEKVKELMFDK